MKTALPVILCLLCLTGMLYARGLLGIGGPPAWAAAPTIVLAALLGNAGIVLGIFAGVDLLYGRAERLHRDPLGRRPPT